MLFVLFLLTGSYTYAQTFTSITTSDKCADINDSNITVEFSYQVGTPFPVDNEFTIELSDASGDFTNATTLETLDGVFNFLFNVNVTISLPKTIEGGDGYKIRVTATDITKSIESNETYSFYYQPNVGIVLNDNKNAFLCDGDSAVIDFDVNIFESINKTSADYSYAIFKDDSLYDVTAVGETSFTVTEEGDYFVLIDSGDCNNNFISLNFASNKMNVEQLSFSSITIDGEDEVQTCASESHTLVSGVNNLSYIYSWFKDDVVITGLPDYSPTYQTTNDGTQFGTYHVVVEAGNCSATSQDVEINEIEAGFTVTAEPDISTENPSVVILLPGSNVTLSAITDLDSSDPVLAGLTYDWAKDGVFGGRPGSQLNVFFEGDYYVEVTDNSGDCPVVENSNPITFLDAVSLEPVLIQDDENCTSESTVLRLDGVNAIATDGESYPLTTGEMVDFEYQWGKNGVDISGATNTIYEVVSYEENASYTVTVSVGSGTTELIDSSTLEVLLRPELTIVSSSESNELCEGDTIDLSIDILPGFTYTWYKGDVALELTDTDASSIEVTESGVYYVTYDGFGCQNTTEQVEINEFTIDSLELSHEAEAVLIDGETLVLVASGVDSYEWFDSDGISVSFTNQVEVDDVGTYTVRGFVGDCFEEKEIQVIPDDGSFTVPNIISPFNGDGKNDTWKIPNKLSLQPSVNVLVYNSKGQEVLNTTDYQNNWPENVSNLRGGMLFYYKIIQENTLIKAGTISVLE